MVRRRFITQPDLPSEGERWLRRLDDDDERNEPTPEPPPPNRPTPAPYGARDTGSISSSADDVLRDEILRAQGRPRGWQGLDL